MTKYKMPLVGVIIPMEGEDTFEESYESVLKQTYDNIVIIVSDSSETHCGEKMLNKYNEGKHETILVFSENSDGISNWQNCWKYIPNDVEIVMYLFPGEVYGKEKVKQLVEKVLEKDNQDGLIPESALLSVGDIAVFQDEMYWWKNQLGENQIPFQCLDFGKAGMAYRRITIE